MSVLEISYQLQHSFLFTCSLMGDLRQRDGELLACRRERDGSGSTEAYTERSCCHLVIGLSSSLSLL